MSTSPPGIAGVFDRAAETYDAVGVPWFGPIAAGLVEALDVQPGERVLDVGCGRGAALVPLAYATGPSGSVLGIDLAPGMVARTAADVAHLPYVEVRVDDASAPDLPEAAYDVVACCLVLFFLPDPLAAVQAWLPALAPGGRVGVTTFGEQDPRWKVLDGVFTPYLPKAMLDARTSGTKGPFASDEGVEGLLRDAGLVDVRTVRREVVTEFADPEQWIRFTWSHGQRAMWEAVPESEHDAVRAEIVQRLTELSQPIRLTQGVRHTLGRRP